MMRAVAVLLFVACAPQIDILKGLPDGGGPESCERIVVQGTCDDAPDLERQLEAQLPCNVCILYHCSCQTRAFCKVCPVDKDWNTVDRAGWGCTNTPTATCMDLKLGGGGGGQ